MHFALFALVPRQTQDTLWAMRMIPKSRLVLLALLVAVGCGDDDSEPVMDAMASSDASTLGEDMTTPRVDQGTADADSNDMARTEEDGGDPPDMGPIGSMGCVDGEGLPEGENRFMLDGRDRRYILRLPNGYTRDRPWPLIFALHGNGGRVGYWDTEGGERDIRGAAANDAIVVVAEAIDRQWRDYNMDASTWPARIELELAYFDRMIEDLSAALCIDPQEIFSMGFSGGGSFSGVLGCRRDYIRAIAVGGSVIYFDRDECVGTPAAWVSITTGDLSEGRKAFRDFFRDRAGCSESTMSTAPDLCVAYDGCDASTPVHFCEHPGGHEWPDVGVAAAWSFFQRFIES